jgi:hypothetical protein
MCFPKPSLVEQICNAYSDGLAAGLRNYQADPSWQPHQGIEELDRWSRREVLMSIYDAAVSAGGHVPDEDIPAIVARYRENEKQTRIFGFDVQGEGAVFTTAVDAIKI